jgi:hypothetical protein
MVPLLRKRFIKYLVRALHQSIHNTYSYYLVLKHSPSSALRVNNRCEIKNYKPRKENVTKKKGKPKLIRRIGDTDLSRAHYHDPKNRFNPQAERLTATSLVYRITPVQNELIIWTGENNKVNRRYTSFSHMIAMIRAHPS